MQKIISDQKEEVQNEQSYIQSFDNCIYNINLSHSQNFLVIAVQCDKFDKQWKNKFSLGSLKQKKLLRFMDCLNEIYEAFKAKISQNSYELQQTDQSLKLIMKENIMNILYSIELELNIEDIEINELMQIKDKQIFQLKKCVADLKQVISMKDQKIEELESKIINMNQRKHSQIEQQDQKLKNNALEAYSREEQKMNFIQKQIEKVQNLYDFLQFPSSRIIKNQEEILMDNWIKESLTQVKSYKLIYKATKDSFESTIFKQKVYSRSNIIILIETKNKQRFGGFSKMKFSHTLIDNYIPAKEQQDCFLFSLSNQKKFKLKANKKEKAISGIQQLDWMLIFGQGDLVISNNSNQNNNSYAQMCSFGEAAQNYELAGQRCFQVEEIEVYQVIQ